MEKPPQSLDWMEFDYDGVDGCRLDTYLRERFRPFSRTAWRRRVSEGLVQVNGHSTSGHRRLRAGDRLRLHADTAGPAPAMGGISILHEDELFVAISKESGILVHPVRLMTRDTVVGYLRPRFPGIRPCHRLDKLTSGLVLLARTASAARAVQQAFDRGDVTKRYLALVEGVLDATEGSILDPIGRDPDSPVRIKMRVDPGGDPSETHYRVLERFSDSSLLAVSPKSGRKHQIRVHLAHIGYPVIGDFLYGREIDVDYFENRSVNLARDNKRWLALHSESLGLDRPDRPGQRLELTASLPERFTSLLERLRKGEEINRRSAPVPEAS